MGSGDKNTSGVSEERGEKDEEENIWGTLEYKQTSRRHQEINMSYGWQPSISFTASKYQRYGFVHEKPFLPGERYSVSREMERNVKGYKEVRRGLTEARELVARQKRERQSMDRPVVTSYYKSPVGTRSSKGSGSVFHSDPVERSYFFSGSRKFDFAQETNAVFLQLMSML